ncbi:hypothetical protein L1049_006240 [Liquidambar formosana]|uniref:Neprosin PEP catalytic domain-containing protein n=1 Tax=Liquidambar formosana TaxID=63359 RepID=A0AAP0RFL7_LIQFO
MCSLLLGNNGVEGSRKLSREEELDLEKQLKLLNKPAVKTIRMRPASHPKSLSRDKDSSTVGKQPLNIGLKGGGCPVGTVPIRRTTKDDLIRAKLFSERLDSLDTNPLATGTSAFHVSSFYYDYAIVRTKSIANRKFKGAGAKISIYNPRVQPLQLSSAQIKIQNGGDSIQVGWTVNPILYGDNRTRLFTFLNVSSIGYADNMFLYAIEDYSGTWWLVMGRDNTKIGFWPQSIFSGLADLGTYVEWGGEVASVQGIPSPEMGTGDFPTGDTKFDAFCRDIVVVNEFNYTVRATYTERFSDDPNYYQVQDKRFTDFGHLVLFGGFGGIIAH